MAQQFQLNSGFISHAQALGNRNLCDKQVARFTANANAATHKHELIAERLGYPEGASDVQARAKEFKILMQKVRELVKTHREQVAFLESEQEHFGSILRENKDVFDDWVETLPETTIALLMRTTISVCRNLDNIRQISDEHRAILLRQEAEMDRIVDSQPLAGSQYAEHAQAAKVDSLEEDIAQARASLEQEREAARRQAEGFEDRLRQLTEQITYLHEEQAVERSNKSSLETDLAVAKGQIRGLEREVLNVGNLKRQLADEELARAALQQALGPSADMEELSNDISDIAIDDSRGKQWYVDFITRLKKQLADLEAKSIAAQKATSSAELETRRLQADLDFAEAREKAETERLTDQGDKLRVAQRNAKAAEAECASLKATVSKLEDETTTLDTQVNDLRIQLMTRSHQADLAEKCKNEFEQLVKELNDDKLKLMTANMTAENQLMHLEQELKAKEILGKVEVDQITGKLNDMVRQRDDAQRQSVQSKEEIVELARTLDEATRQLSQVKGQIISLTGTLEETTLQRDAARQQLSQAKEEVIQLTGALADAARQRDDAQQQLDQSREELARLSGTLDEITHQRDNARQQLSQAKEEVTRLTGALDETTRQLSQAKGQIIPLTGTLEETRQQSGQAKEEVIRLTGALADAARQRDDAQRQLDQSKEELARLTGTLDEISHQRDDSRQQLSQYTSNNAQLVDEIRSSATTIEQITRERDEYIANNARLTDEARSSATTIEQITRERDESKASNDRLVDEARSSASTIELITRERDEYIANNARLADEARQITRERDETQVQLTQVHNQIDALSKTLQGAETKLQKLDDQHQQQSTALLEAIRGREDAEGQTGQFGAEVAEVRQREETLKAEVARLAAEARASEQVLQSEQASHADTKIALEHILGLLQVNPGPSSQALTVGFRADMQKLDLVEAQALPAETRAWRILAPWDPDVIIKPVPSCDDVFHLIVQLRSVVDRSTLTDTTFIDLLNQLTACLCKCEAIPAALFTRFVRDMAALLDQMQDRELSYPVALGLFQLADVGEARCPGQLDLASATDSMSRWLRHDHYAELLDAIMDGDITKVCFHFQDHGFYGVQSTRYVLMFHAQDKTVCCVPKDKWDCGPGGVMRLHGPQGTEPILLPWTTPEELGWWADHMVASTLPDDDEVYEAE